MCVSVSLGFFSFSFFGEEVGEISSVGGSCKDWIFIKSISIGEANQKPS